VPMTNSVSGALRDHRHRRGPLVLTGSDGGRLSGSYCGAGASGRATGGPREHGAAHSPAHLVFAPGDAPCPPRGIQELAGHRDFITTQRYMHLNVPAIDNAIRLLEAPAPIATHEGIFETGPGGEMNSNG